VRREAIDKEGDLRIRVNELGAKLSDREKVMEELVNKKKTIKMHKKVLKDEVLRLRKELNEVEIKA